MVLLWEYTVVSGKVSAQPGTTLPEPPATKWHHVARCHQWNGDRKAGCHLSAMWLGSRCLPCSSPFCPLEADPEAIGDGQAQMEGAWVPESPWGESLKTRNSFGLLSFLKNPNLEKSWIGSFEALFIIKMEINLNSKRIKEMMVHSLRLVIMH